MTFYLSGNLKIVILNFQAPKFLAQEESLSNTSGDGRILKEREGWGGGEAGKDLSCIKPCQSFHKWKKAWNLVPLICRVCWVIWKYIWHQIQPQVDITWRQHEFRNIKKVNFDSLILFRKDGITWNLLLIYLRTDWTLGDSDTYYFWLQITVVVSIKHT